MHGTVTAGAHFAGDLIGFSAELLITVLLLALTLRAARLPGTPLANVLFAVCALLWSAGGLAYTALIAAGMAPQSGFVLVAQAVHFSGAGAFPIPILIVWRAFAVIRWQKTASRLLLAVAGLTTAVAAICLWSPVVSGYGHQMLDPVKHFAFYNAAVQLAIGSVISLRRGSTPRAVYFPSLAIVLAIAGAAITMAVARSSASPLEYAGPIAAMVRHLLLVVILCAFLLFARFRFADVFIRYSIRLLLAAAWATMLAFTAQSPDLAHWIRRAPSAQAVHVFAIVLFGNILLLSFAFVDERISAAVNRWLFRAPDYRARIRQLGEELRLLPLESEIARAVEAAARDTLLLDYARLIPIEQLPPGRWPAGVAEGEIVELERRHPLAGLLPLPNVELLVPVASAGHVAYVLAISPGATRPGLVMHDLNCLRAIASQCGNRLDALRLEREAIERQTSEALLLQQVTEAELRALRSQINPHFLFNSLNTIADLIVRDPPRAEAMTLRLASVFRHVLAHSSRPLTSIREEMEFLRTYLYIEEARFGDRLQVEMDVAPEIAGEHIPSLILQPLVENALKHGLGPKPGPGHLWISARAQGDQVRLRIEDDGMGPAPESAAKPNGHSAAQAGLGLTNVAERLRTLYRDRAALCFEARAAGGSQVTLLIPRGVGAPAL